MTKYCGNTRDPGTFIQSICCETLGQCPLCQRDDEIAGLKEELVIATSEEPGTPRGRFKWLHEWAGTQEWYNGYLSNGLETQLIEHLATLKARNAELEKAIEDAYEHLRKGLEVME